MNINDKIYIAGGDGMVGSAIMRALRAKGYGNILSKSIRELDLRNQQAADDFFANQKPDYVFLAAAKVGGIHANNMYPAQFIYDNLMIATNIIHSSYKHNVKKLLFLGSSCIYPKMAAQPIKEEYLLSGYLEPTNEAYAVAKIAGIELCKFYRKEYGCNFISAMPTNLYGINDNFDLQNSHVLPALIRKFYEAKQQNSDSVVIWGSGAPKREFLFVDDLADACIFLMKEYNEALHVNVGTGEDIAIRELAAMIKNIVGYQGTITNDTGKPDGTPRKLLDVSLLHKLGWKHKTSLEEGIQKVYEWYKKNNV